MQGIYAIRNKVTRKVYVGSSVNIEGRFKKHRMWLRKGVHWNEHLQRAWQKDGEDSFSLEILEEVADLASLRAYEQKWVDKHMAADRKYGYNKAECTDTPYRGKHLSEDHKKKVSDGLKKHTRTAEHSKKIADSNRGKPKSEQTRKKIAVTLKGKPHSEEHKAKISEGLRRSGRIYQPATEETRAKLSKALTGKYKTPGKPSRTTLWKLRKQHGT